MSALSLAIDEGVADFKPVMLLILLVDILNKSLKVSKLFFGHVAVSFFLAFE